MVELQVLNKILKDKNDSILQLNNITRDYFDEYIEEYDWIMNHKSQYGNIPDVETFLGAFQDFDVINISESPEYLVASFKEEYLYRQAVPILQTLADKLQTNSYEAVDYLKTKLPELKVEGVAKGIDIISQAKERYDEWKETKENQDSHFIATGFEELDEIIGGLHCGEELLVLFARTGVGKTWVAIKMLEHCWKMNKRVGLLEPEMTANRIGYRFDTIHQHISSRALYKGEDIQGYEKYISKLSQSTIPFYVTHPKDFNKSVTVSKLKSWCETNKLDVLAIDGISYLTDDRKQRGDNKTTSLTNISEDLMQLSIDLGIPVIVIVQSNRGGAINEDLQLENIRDSDGIAYNASIVISIQQKETGLQLVTNKVRNGPVNNKLVYLWDSDLGTFQYIPQPERGEKDEEKAEDLRRRYNDREDGEY